MLNLFESKSRLAVRNVSASVSQAVLDEVRTVKMVLTFCIPIIELKPKNK